MYMQVMYLLNNKKLEIHYSFFPSIVNILRENHISYQWSKQFHTMFRGQLLDELLPEVITHTLLKAVAQVVKTKH